MADTPIVTKIEDAPETGDAVFSTTGPSPTYGYPVKNRERYWQMESIGGWQTWARLVYFDPDYCRHILAGTISLAPDHLFAPTAEEAVNRYNKLQPFGSVTLHYGGDWLGFRASSGELLVSFKTNAWIIRHEYSGDASKLRALHALIGEVVAYQQACAAGRTDSRIHKALQEMKAVNSQ